MPQKLRPSYKFNAEQLEQLKQIVPEAFKDGMLDFSSLYDALSDYNEEDSLEMDDNFYGLYWPGKRQAKRAASIPPRGTLVPVKGDGVDEEKTKNVYIEGDNLEVLKLLQKSYAGKIKMIYIDPPYNTGNDFVYNDDFSETAEAFGKATGQLDEQGEKQTTNTRADGRFHSKWMNMMYPRLKLAHRLLSDDGVIFISIDDNEVAQLRKICDEIFGEENFVGCFPWRKRTAKSDVPFGISQDYEWVICFSNSEIFVSGTETTSRKYYDSNDYPGRPWRIHDMSKQTTASERPNSFFDMIDPKTGKSYPANPKAVWRVTKETFKDYYDAGRIIFPGDYEFLNISKPVLRYFKDDDQKKDGNWFGYSSISTHLPKEVGMTQDGTKEIDELFSDKIFNFPKPVNLIKYFIKMSTILNPDSIILDFFSGSATTAHAVMQLNAEDGGNRQFIMVQWPEKCDEKSEAYKAGFKNICEIGKERIRRAGGKLPVASRQLPEGEGEGKLPVASRQLPERREQQNLELETGNPKLETKNPKLETKDWQLDTGFKVFRLAPSNYKKWQNYTGTDIKEAENLFAQYENPLVDNWKEEDLLTEIMLAEGFPLDSAVSVIKDFKKNKVTQISSDFCEHSLFVCLDKTINAETINTLALSEHDIFICLDNAVTDQDKARLDDKGLIKTI